MMFLATVLLSASAWAYIPEFSTIASRAAEQHGKGAYQVEQEVTFRRESETYTVKETWQVQNENEMRLILEGRGPLKGLVSGTVLYHSSTKSFSDNGQPVRQVRLTDEWWEPLFYFRSSKWFRNRMAALKVTPSEALQDRPPMGFEGDPKYEPPSFVRLSRSGGAVNWAIGVPPSIGNAPTVWIEQDQFVVRKFKGAGGASVKADDYAKYDNGFWYPRARTYNYGPFIVTVQTLSVKPLGNLPASDNRFKSASLVPARDGLKLPEAEALKEFYTRFR